MDMRDFGFGPGLAGGLLMAFLMISATAVVALNLVADLSYRAIDKRVEP